jgi:hypothetical protein
MAVLTVDGIFKALYCYHYHTHIPTRFEQSR